MKETLRKIMKLAWQFVKRNGFSLSEALKESWANIKLVNAMHKGIVKFYFTKVDGSKREAYGTLSSEVIPPVGGERKNNDTCQVYFDTEKQAWRCFKKANLAI